MAVRFGSLLGGTGGGGIGPNDNIVTTGTITAYSFTSTGGSYTSAASYIAAANSAFYWLGSSVMSAPSDGIILFSNQAVTDFLRLQFGGTTSSFPAIERNAAGINIIRADDTGTGLSIIPAAAGAGVTIGVVSSGSNESIAINPLGTGIVTVNAANTTAFGVVVTGTASISSVYAQNTTSTIMAEIDAFGSTAGSTSFGLSRASMARVLLTGTTVVIGTDANVSLQFGTNNTIKGLVTGGGLWAFGAGTGTPTYGLHLASTSGLTVGQTVFIQDATASTGLTRMVLKGGAQGGNILEVRDVSNTLYSSVTDLGFMSTTAITLATTGYLQWTNKGYFSPAASDGVFLISNYAATDFGRLQFGGTTSSFPALKRSSTILQARLADDSAYAPLAASVYYVGAVAGIDASITSGDLVGKTITVSKGVITGYA